MVLFRIHVLEQTYLTSTLNIDTYVEISDHPENECRHIEAEERGRNKQKHFRDFSLRHSVPWSMSSLIRSVGFYGQSSSDVLELVDVARYQYIEDHYYGQGYGECHDGVNGVIGHCPGFPVLIQVTDGQVSS